MDQPADTAFPLLSIIIVSYNSLPDLQRCLPTFGNQSVAAEVIVVDNHGADGVADWLRRAYPSVILLPNPVNSGYAGGNNLGLERARGRWTLFLNPDTEVAPGCLTRLLDTAVRFPTAFINPKLLNPDGTINACGNQMHYTGITTCRYLNEPSASAQTLESVPLLSGAALLAPTAGVRHLGGFDETYFMYFEDADLSLRARLAGFPLLCDARAVVTHHYQLGMNPVKFYYLERNRLLTFLKIFSRPTLRQLAPALILTELLTWGYALRGWPYFKSRLRTYGWLWQHRVGWRAAHQIIQRSKTVAEADLLRGSLVSLPFAQLLAGPAGRWLDRLIRPVYRLLRPGFLKP